MTNTRFAPTVSKLSAPVRKDLDAAFCLLGPSTAVAELWSKLRLVHHARTILLVGEPHCGQQAIARMLLDLSSHPDRELVTLTSADAEAQLSQSQASSLFPADMLLFLPDADRLSPAAQEALVRLVRIRRNRPFQTVACTEESLRDLVDTGHFSTALASFLSGIQITIPSLRKRSVDLPVLVHHLVSFLADQAKLRAPELSQDFLQAITRHSWPDNLRELEDALRPLTLDGSREVLHEIDLLQVLAKREVLPRAATPQARLVTLDTIVQEHIQSVLRACRGNKLRAAEVLGISRSTLYRMLDTATISTQALPLAS